MGVAVLFFRGSGGGALVETVMYIYIYVRQQVAERDFFSFFAQSAWDSGIPPILYCLLYYLFFAISPRTVSRQLAERDVPLFA